MRVGQNFPWVLGCGLASLTLNLPAAADETSAAGQRNATGPSESRASVDAEAPSDEPGDGEAGTSSDEVTETADIDIGGETVLIPERRGGFKRPHGVAEFGVGFLTLPDAQVCVERTEAGCRNGDTSLEVNVWPLYRASKRLALGAGLTLALTPTTDAPRNDPPGIPRDHSRRYFMAEAIGRYYPWVSPNFEGWLGATTGLVVLSDTFKSQREQPEQVVVGNTGVTIRTEGFTLGVAAGVAWPLSAKVSLGGTLRIANWILPEEPASIAIGDEASLTGRVTMFDLGLVLTYHAGK